MKVIQIGIWIQNSSLTLRDRTLYDVLSSDFRNAQSIPTESTKPRMPLLGLFFVNIFVIITHSCTYPRPTHTVCLQVQGFKISYEDCTGLESFGRGSFFPPFLLFQCAGLNTLVIVDPLCFYNIQMSPLLNE